MSDRAHRARSTADLLFRRRAGQLGVALARAFGLEHLDLIEDVIQDAFVKALRVWPRAGVPDDPAAWILRVARNGAVDALRRRGRWERKREELEAVLPEGLDRMPDYFSGGIDDDELRLIMAICHPDFPGATRVALTLRTAGGFTTAEVARAFLARESAIQQRLVRARRALKEGSVVLTIPPAAELPARLDSVLEVLYLMFNEGYDATSADDLVRAELCGEAIRIAELLAAHPEVGVPRVHALAALFRFQAARISGRTDRGGDLLPLERQDRSRWDRGSLKRGLEHFERSARGEELSPYHLQAEIASCHALAPAFEETDWARILACYDLLRDIAPSPIVELNRAVAVAQVRGAAEGLRALAPVRDDRALARYDHRHAVEAELLARTGRYEEAGRAAERAARVTASRPRREYFEGRAADYRGRAVAAAGSGA